MAKKKMTQLDRIEEMLLGSNDAGLEAINRVERKLNDFIRRTDEAITKLLGKKEEDEPGKHVLQLVPKSTRKKHLPVLYYEGTLRLPNGKSKAKWTEDLEDAATDSYEGLVSLVEELESGVDVPTDYKTNIIGKDYAVDTEGDE